MAMRIGSNRRKTRQLYAVRADQKGKISIRKYFQRFAEGDSVHIGVDAAVHRALPFRRFVGRSGTIVGMQGDVYCVRITDGGKSKTLLIHPAHLRRMKVQ
jgi:large subunit ribosomal protein L21e